MPETCGAPQRCMYDDFAADFVHGWCQSYPNYSWCRLLLSYALMGENEYIFLLLYSKDPLLHTWQLKYPPRWT